jgi:hypothetical protein
MKTTTSLATNNASCVCSASVVGCRSDHDKKPENHGVVLNCHLGKAQQVNGDRQHHKVKPENGVKQVAA